MRTDGHPRQPVELLFGAYRRRILALLLLRPDESFYVRQISRLARVPAGSLHRELKALAAAGLLVRSTLGNQVRYEANRACPIHEALAAIFRTATGIAEVDARRADVAALCRRFHVRELDLFGSAARGGFDPARSDLDFVVTFEDLPPVDFAEAFFRLRGGLVALFGRPVDLLTTDSIRNPYLRESIARDRQVLYAA